MDTIKAIVQKVIREGKHGPFAVATSDQLDGSVTFSLEPTVWTEDDWPEQGMVVILGKLIQKRAGWRAKEGRFFKPSDEQNQQPERSKQVQFLYPTSRQFPVDEVSEQIVRELEKRNWNVPGITVEFHDYGTGDQKFRAVGHIKSQDFKLWFCRKQRTMPGGRWNDTAAVTEIVIPKKELHVYEDESGPTFYLYVGNDYEKDRERFMSGSKVNSKLNNEPRMYLKYKGSADREGKYTYSKRRSPYLVHDDDIGREYEPKGKEPKVLMTVEVMGEFRQYLTDVVLKTIMSHPIPMEKIDVLAPPATTPFPESFGSIFCFGEYRDAERIKQGKADASQLPADERYGLIGSGYRLMSLGTSNDGTVPKIAYGGFLWCGLGEVTAETPIEKLEVYGHYRWSDRERFVIRLKPTKADAIYIADHAAYEKRRKELGDAMEKGRDLFTDAEVADFTCARARTIVPITEYKGGYEQPVVLVNRELSFDEVELVSGPHNERR